MADQLDQEVTSVALSAPRWTDARRSLVCPLCQAPKRVGRNRCEACRAARFQPSAAVHCTRDFALDKGAQDFVGENRDGATLKEVGVALGITRERVRQIETTALRKLRAALKRQGLSGADVMSVFAQRVTRGEDLVSSHSDKHAKTVAQLAQRNVARAIELAQPSEMTQQCERAFDEHLPESRLREFEALADLVRHAARLAEIDRG